MKNFTKNETEMKQDYETKMINVQLSEKELCGLLYLLTDAKYYHKKEASKDENNKFDPFPVFHRYWIDVCDEEYNTLIEAYAKYTKENQ